LLRKAILALEDGVVYEGHSFGASVQGYGEVVFNTSMTGYQEILTDPSYSGQIVILTYTLIGNYGINAEDFESKRIQVSGFVVREDCDRPSHWQSTNTLGEFLAEAGVPGISGVDTRSLTRKIRSAGVRMGIITSEMTSVEALEQLEKMPRYDDVDFVKGVSTEALYEWDSMPGSERQNALHVVVIDCGLKYNILRILQTMGCRITVVPCSISAKGVFDLNPDGVLLSPGPGDPSLLGYMIETIQSLVGHIPIMGICLGLQLLGLSFGAKTFKLKFGHRGANQPVKDLRTGKVMITSQNHGFCVDPHSLDPTEVEFTQINLNDQTLEGMRHKRFPIFSVQYHPEASPGPHDTQNLFGEFIRMMELNLR